MSDENSRFIELLGSENGYGNDSWCGSQVGVMIASVYQTSAGNSEVIEKLVARIREVLFLNEWMMGRLQHKKHAKNHEDKKKAGKSRVVAVVDEKFCDPDDYIIRDTNDKFFSEMKNYNTMCDILSDKKYHIGQAKTIWDKDDGKFAKFGIMENTAKDKFCLFFVGSHIMFDGTTLYQTWKMLDFKEDIFEIQDTRFQNFEKSMSTEMSILPEGMELIDWYKSFMKGYLAAAIRKGIAQNLKGCKSKKFLLEFDMEAVAKEKAKYKTATSFVSTNDVLTAWMRQIVPKATNIMMAINLRERIKNIPMTAGGNYLAAPLLLNKDLETPATVRAWLKARLTPGNPIPTVGYSDFKKYLGGVHTNWSTFYHHVEPEGCEQLQHFPVIRFDDSGSGPLPFGCEMHLITYQSNKNQLAGFVVTKRKELTLEKLEQDALVKCKLMDTE